MEITFFFCFTTCSYAGYNLSGCVSFVTSDVWDHKNRSVSYWGIKFGMTTSCVVRVNRLKIKSLPSVSVPSLSHFGYHLIYELGAEQRNSQTVGGRKSEGRVSSLCLLLSGGELRWIFTCFHCHLDEFIQIKQRTKTFIHPINVRE